MIDIKDIEFRVRKILDKVRPYLVHDGGDVEFIRYQDGIVYLRMLGACTDCMSIDSTFNDGIEAMILESVPGVVEVRNVAMEEMETENFEDYE